ncbi:MAG: tetratricopeptide repeat protein [Crocinitomicaceae bacterium]|nr:tetratricopeptide repeat protein [Crocinitomicaceae bacterium]
MNREYAKGIAKVKENDFLNAIKHFTLAINENPADVESYAERAVAYIHVEKHELSMFDMNRCIELEPGNSYRYSCRAFLKSKMGDVDGAIADYEIAVQLDPDDAIAYNNLGLAQESKGYQKKAEKSFSRSNEIIGYNPKRFDEGFKIDETKSEQIKSETIPASAATKEESKKAHAKKALTTKEGFKDFMRFIRNGFKIKE